MRPAPVRVGPTTTDPVVGCSDTDALLLSADTAASAVATESMILVDNCKAKYTDLQVKLSEIYGQLSAAENRLASTISLIQQTDQIMATASDMYRNCKAMVLIP